jgi:hypothetical protein
MSIIYNKLNNDFTQIPNTILTDTRVSALAFKIYCYICYRINISEKWEFYNEEIVSHFKEKIKAFLRAKNELLEYGYLQKVKQNKGDGGRFKGCDYIIYKEPLSPIPQNGSSVSGSSVCGSSEKGVTNNKDKINKDINKKDCIAEQSNFSQNETLVLTQENFETKWFDFIKEEPKAGFEAKYQTFKQNWFAKSKGKNKNDYKNWEAYFKEDWIKHEFNLDPALDPLKIAEQEALEIEKRIEEMRSAKEEVEKFFEKNEYEANLTNVFQEKVKEARGENTLKQIEDVKVVEFNKSERCIVLSGSEASRNTIYINHTSWINKLKLGVSFNKIYCLTLEELKKYKQKELDLNEIKTII